MRGVVEATVPTYDGRELVESAVFCVVPMIGAGEWI